MTTLKRVRNEAPMNEGLIHSATPPDVNERGGNDIVHADDRQTLKRRSTSAHAPPEQGQSRYSIRCDDVLYRDVSLWTRQPTLL
jgi:hypothetical protein